MSQLARTLALAALAALTSAVAFAQAEDPPPPRNVRHAEVTYVDFVTQDVTASVERPEGDMIVERKPAVFHSMIPLRRDFNEEMDASVTAVR
ncbi:MAG: hypothetical protein H6739_41025 [Alphaproteobacteria bacterium]|nr:hypothetical protein [Alphaproteobacteria bacterium]